jgi:hypothetical protein
LLVEVVATELDATTVTTTGATVLVFVVDGLLVDPAPMDAVGGLFVTTTWDRTVVDDSALEERTFP